MEKEWLEQYSNHPARQLQNNIIP